MHFLSSDAGAVVAGHRLTPEEEKVDTAALLPLKSVLAKGACFPFIPHSMASPPVFPASASGLILQ